MYTSTHFDETRADVLHDLIARHPLATVIVNGAQGLVADHIPFELAAPTADAPFGVLRAHVARANPLWRHVGEAMLVFQGPAAYVSPSLYEEKAISGKVVPTWNYAVVHAHGTLRAVDDPAWLFGLLDRLTDTHEAARAAPWKVEDAPREWLEKIMRAIVGIEIPVQRLQGKWKMGQHRSMNDQRMVTKDTGLAIHRNAPAAGSR
jgi:transcriptional regulator